jgi:phosphoribosylglycinamide formyltransferase
MLIVTPDFLNPMAQAKVPIINLHPALPKQFDGANAIQRAHQAWLEGSIDKTGVMIHYVM